MTEHNQLADLYGPVATHSEYRVGERVAWLECGVEQHGVVIHVAAATPGRPLTYVVSPDIAIFPVELGAHEIIG